MDGQEATIAGARAPLAAARVRGRISPHRPLAGSERVPSNA
jgi:hypothetical protein